MSIQIKSIILYNANGDTRVLNFEIGNVNIITGRSNRGKSAIINIVEYCLGQSEFRIPQGKIRDNVKWYGVIYQINKTQILIAKPSPSDTAISQSRVYLESGTNISPPAMSKLVPNSNDEAISSYISRLIGISSNLTEESEVKDSYEAKLAHSRFYLFQDQWLIANPIVLFHRQAEPYIAQTIKDTLPFFLGATREEQLKYTNELSNAKRELRSIQRDIKEHESILSKKARIGQGLIIEAQQIGLISENTPKSNEEMIRLLKESLNWKPRTLHYSQNNDLAKLNKELDKLRKSFKEKLTQIDNAEFFARNREGYLDEAFEQERRLSSINLLDHKDIEQNKCPLCSSNIPLPIPSISAIKMALSDLNDNILYVRKEDPKLERYIQGQKEELEILRNQIDGKEIAIKAVLKEEEAARQIHENDALIAHVTGRISLYLDTIDPENDYPALLQKQESLKSLISYFEEKLSHKGTEEKLKSALDTISHYMTNWAKELQLEHSEYAYLLDLNKLTVIADRPGRPISMGQGGMGGGKNWLGCHLITHLALHRFFMEKNRPVPHFLFLDQPSQVYFPSEKYENMEGRKEELEHSDMSSVKRLFDLLFRYCDDFYPNFQIIVMEHANLDTAEYQDALVEPPWFDERALIPKDWYSRNNPM